MWRGCFLLKSQIHSTETGLSAHLVQAECINTNPICPHYAMTLGTCPFTCFLSKYLFKCSLNAVLTPTTSFDSSFLITRKLTLRSHYVSPLKPILYSLILGNILYSSYLCIPEFCKPPRLPFSLLHPSENNPSQSYLFL